MKWFNNMDTRKLKLMHGRVDVDLKILKNEKINEV